MCESRLVEYVPREDGFGRIVKAGLSGVVQIPGKEKIAVALSAAFENREEDYVLTEEIAEKLDLPLVRTQQWFYFLNQRFVVRGLQLLLVSDSVYGFFWSNGHSNGVDMSEAVARSMQRLLDLQTGVNKRRDPT